MPSNVRNETVPTDRVAGSIGHTVGGQPTMAKIDPTADLRALSAVGAIGLVGLSVLPNVGPLCPLRRLTGVPCPLCGGTTAALALTRGDVVGALAANPLAVLAIVVVAAAWGLWALAAAGKIALSSTKWSVAPKVALSVLGLSWIFQLHRYDVL